MHASRKGFTLVEVALVIVIIGLIVGGLIAGSSLIGSAESKVIIAEKAKYAESFYAFREKYKALPGDMPDAYEFWGAGCGSNTNALNTGCNGNGNGRIGRYENAENAKLWEHLSLAKLVTNSFDGTGVDDGSGGVYITFTNAMKSAYPKGVWDINNDPENAMLSPDVVFLRLGSIDPSASNIGLLPDLTHGMALAIDKKIDDGKANTGKMVGDGMDACYDIGTDYYQISAVGENYKGDCILHFILQ